MDPGTPYTLEDLKSITGAEFPKRGDWCPKCRGYIPRFADLTVEVEATLRSLSKPERLERIREITGCNARWAKIWAIHPHGPEPVKSGPPCPFCGMPLYTDKSKQCSDCGWDWHDPANPVNLKAT